jgi:hypothetical protein
MMLIVSLPVAWLPWSAQTGAVTTGGRAVTAWGRAVGFFSIVFGRAASLDCLIQARGWWHRYTAFDISSSVFFRAAVR